MALDGLFGLENSDSPVWEKKGQLSALTRWGPASAADADRELAGDEALAAEIRRRPKPIIMQMADYGGDGAASAFLLQVGTLPCGKLQYVAIGVSRAKPKLHALPSTAHPDTPVILPSQAWRALASGPGRHTVVSWECDDHGSDVHSEIVVSAKGGIVSALNRDYSCPHDPGHPHLVGEKPL